MAGTQQDVFVQTVFSIALYDNPNPSFGAGRLSHEGLQGTGGAQRVTFLGVMAFWGSGGSSLYDLLQGRKGGRRKEDRKRSEKNSCFCGFLNSIQLKILDMRRCYILGGSVSWILSMLRHYGPKKCRLFFPPQVCHSRKLKFEGFNLCFQNLIIIHFHVCLYIFI